MKPVFVILFIFLALSAAMFLYYSSFFTQEFGSVHKQKYLCDKTITNCNNNDSPSIPKGVCKLVENAPNHLLQISYTFGMFLIARKSDVRIRKTVPPLHNNAADLLLKNLSFDFLEITDFDTTLVADYHLIYYVSDGQMRVIINGDKYLLLRVMVFLLNRDEI